MHIPYEENILSFFRNILAFGSADIISRFSRRVNKDIELGDYLGDKARIAVTTRNQNTTKRHT